MTKGKFIVFEGGEGAGKTTQIKLLKEKYAGRDDIVFTREPGGSVFAEKIRDLILSDDAKDADGLAMLGLFVAARADHARNTILPALAAGKLVLSDRYLAATYAYQVIAQKESRLETLFWEHAKLVPQPTATVYFEIDPKLGMERVARRSGEQNHFDQRELDFHYQIQNGFKEYMAKSGGVFEVIDASHDEKTMTEIVERILSKYGVE